MTDMTVEALAASCGLRQLALPDSERPVNGVYIGDLLSWVMGRARSENAWITIMSNINVIAVASLSDVSCVIFAEGVVPDEDVIRAAEQKGVNLLVSDLPIYETAEKLSTLKI